MKGKRLKHNSRATSRVQVKAEIHLENLNSGYKIVAGVQDITGLLSFKVTS